MFRLGGEDMVGTAGKATVGADTLEGSTAKAFEVVGHRCRQGGVGETVETAHAHVDLAIDPTAAIDVGKGLHREHPIPARFERALHPPDGKLSVTPVAHEVEHRVPSPSDLRDEPRLRGLRMSGRGSSPTT
jgi:hypothetical protein